MPQCNGPSPPSPNVMDMLGTQFADAPTNVKIWLIDQAIGRVMWSQRSETGNNANTRADLQWLLQARKDYREILVDENFGETFFIGVDLMR